MAAQQIVNSHQSDVESLVNRWVVDYYLSLALELLQNRQYADFCDIRDVLAQVLLRPFEATDVMQTKIRILEFLSRIYEGENIDSSFESDHSVSPLESALVVLENINQQSSIPQQDFKKVCTSLKEMMVAILIKNNEFDRAKMLLRRHFPKPNVGKKAIFTDLISQKTKRHQVIEQINFQQFKEDMLAFSQSLCPFTVPFLHKAAKRLIESLPEEDDKAGGPDEQNDPGPSTTPEVHIIHFMPSKISIIQRTRLEAVFKALAANSVEGRTFAQLEEEVEKDLSLHLSPAPLSSTSQDSEQDGLFQRGSGSPMEASPADQPPQTDAVPETQAESRSNIPAEPRNRHLYTVARLVVELDSQETSQCTTASQAMEAEVRTENPPESPAAHNKRHLQNPVTDIEVAAPIRKLPRRTNTFRSRASTSRGETSADSEEDPPGPVADRETCVEKQHNGSLSSDSAKSKQLSLDSEEDAQEVPAPFKTPVKKPPKQLASDSSSSNPSHDCVIDSSGDSSPNLFSPKRAPGTSSTPQKDSAQGDGPSQSKWKRLYNNAKESKDTWSDEESYFPSKKNRLQESTLSNSGHRKMKWTESETQRLKEGVKKFGEGNWSKIKAYYSFEGRTNINLKDRWRTMKKLKMV